jgi:hypothetical protein
MNVDAVKNVFAVIDSNGNLQRYDMECGFDTTELVSAVALFASRDEAQDTIDDQCEDLTVKPFTVVEFSCYFVRSHGSANISRAS